MKIRRTFSFVLAISALVSLFSAQAKAESCPLNSDGDYVLDSWSGNGDVSYDVLVQPDDKLVVAGFSSPGGSCPGSYSCMALVRYDAFGCRDTSFGSGGLFTPSLGSLKEAALGITRQADGKLVVVGVINRTAPAADDLFVARANSNGTMDTTFNSTGYNALDISGRWDQANAVGIQSLGANAGKIIAAGYSMDTIVTPGTGNDSLLARFRSNGVLDTGTSGFGSGSKRPGYVLKNVASGKDDYINALAIQSDDKIVAVGNWSDPAGPRQGFLMRYTADGLADSTFGSGGVALPALGGASVVNGFTGVALQSDGKIVVSGDSTGLGVGTRAFLIARFTASGALDTGFNAPNGYALVDVNPATTNEQGKSIRIQADGKIVVAGYALKTAYAVRLNSDGSPDVTFGSNGVKSKTSLDATEKLIGNRLGILSNGNIIVQGRRETGAGSQQPMILQFWP